MNTVDAGPGRPTPGPLRQTLKGCFIADGYGLDAAIAAISHPARQPQPARLAAHRVAKTYALHLAVNL